MSSVDDRIVNMQFNNKQFTQGAAESQKSLEGLDRTIANTGKGTGLTTMGSAVDGISAKFSALQVAGVTALATIVSKATSAGLSMIKSLTLDPITQGFSEYTTNLNSIQTVVANTGESVNKVNSYMQKLNAYSDQTIYNFSEMAKNIGTFTAAGVDLDTATSAIQGIANLAALSGSNSQQASTAMYQLSQAIAAGKVGLMDWNSVVNAGMGGKVFQTALAQTAVGMGQISASAVDLGGKMGKLTVNGQAFRASISAAAGGESWLTSDVLVKTLEMLDGRLSTASYRALGFSKEVARQKVEMEQAKLAAEGYSEAQIKSMTDVAQRAYDAATTVKSLPQLMQVVKESIGSMWANSFQIILGDFEQSKKLWNAVGSSLVGPSGVITKISNAWTGMLRGFVTVTTGGQESGRTKLIEGLSRTFRNLGKVMGAVKKAWQDVFPPAADKNMTNIGKAVNRLSRYLIISKDTVADLRTIFAGFFSILHIGFSVLKGVGAFFINIFKAIADNSGPAGSGILSLVASVAELITKFDKVVTSGGQISEVMGEAGTAVGKFIAPVLQGIGRLVQGFASLASGSGVGAFTEQFYELQVIIEAFQSSTENGMAALADIFGDVTVPVEQLTSAFEGLKAKIQSLLQSGGIESAFSNMAGGASSAVAGGLEIASGIISGIAAGIASAAPELWAAITSVALSIVEIFKSVLGIHSPSTEMVEPGTDIIRGIVQGIFAGAALLGQAVAAVGNFLKDAFTQLFGDMDALDFAALINSIISGGFLIALTNILNTFGGAGFFSGFADIFDQLGNSLQAFQQNLKAQALLAIGIAVTLLVGSLVLLALLDPKQIGQGLGTIAIMMGLLVGSLAALSKWGGGAQMVIVAGAMNEMATSIVILSGAIAILGNMKPETVGQGLTAMAIALALMVGAAKALSGISGSLVAAGASMVLMATSMSLLAGAVLAFGSINPDKLGQGMTAMAIGLALMVGALLALGTIGPAVFLAGAAMVLVAGAMSALAASVALFGSMDPDTLNQGMVSMALSLALLTGSLLVLGPLGPGVLAAAAGIAVLAGSLVVMASVIGVLGSMDQQTLAQGLLAIAAALAILLGAAAIAELVAPGLLVLGVSIAYLGAGIALAGAGMFLFATALTLLSVVGVAAIAIMIIAIEAFVALLPSIAVQLAASFVSFLETLAKAAPRIHDAFSTIFEEMLGIIIDAAPKIQQVLLTLLLLGISTIKHTVPAWIDMGMEIITRFLEGIARRVPRIAEAALGMIEKFLTVVDNHLGDIIDKGTDIVVSFLEGIGKSSGRISRATGQLILDILEGIDQAIVDYSTPIRNKGLEIIGHLIDGMTGGLAGKITSAVGEAVKAGLNAIDLSGVDITPGFDVPGVPFARGAARGANPFKAAQDAIRAAFGLVNSDISEGDASVAAAQREAMRKSAAAETARANAAIARKAANEATKKAEKKGAGKGAKQAAEKAERIANRLEAKAQAAEDRASNAADALQDAISYRDADLGGKGDIRSEEAAELAERANNLLARANAEAEKARTLTGKAAKKMMEQARKDAEAAKRLADQAKAAQIQANSFYEQEVNARIAEMEAGIAAAEKKRAEDAAFEAADQAGKAKILKDRAVASQAEADAAKQAAAALILQAKALAATDAAAAMNLLDQAEEQAKIAQEAADRAEQERKQAEQLLNQPGTSSGGGGGIQPSRSVLEDAAKVVDRYSQSLQEATALAGATQQVVQYNQTVNSPVALSPSEVYRQTKNLVSATETNLGQQVMPQPPSGG